jgi:homoserine dehydrogenase
MPHHRLVLVGFGNVGRAFARLITRKQDLLKKRYSLTFSVTGILTGTHGAAIDPDGIDLSKAVSLVEARQSISDLSRQTAPLNGVEFIHACPGEVLFENTPVNHHTGQPAIDHLKAALQEKMHAVTANKGPVVHGYQELHNLAEKMDRRFFFESAVMDGAPIFSLFREALPAVELRGFRGILNSCTNMLLDRMTDGANFEDAVRYAQSIGIAETDPSADIDGWDAAIKVAALSTVLMGIPLKPQEVDRVGIRGLTQQDLLSARELGKKWKLVCTARRSGDSVSASVKPEMVGSDSPLFSIMGTSSYCQFEMDTLPGLGIVESDPGPETTAYGLLADWLHTI